MDFNTKSTGIYLSLSVMKWAAWKFLAATTAVLAGGVGYQYAVENIPGYEITLAAISIMLTYLAVDYGLGKLLSYYYDYAGVQDDQVEPEAMTYRKKLLLFLFAFIIIRFLLTVTISYWSAGEVADRITDRKDADYFITALEHQDSAKLAAQSNAERNLSKLSSSEAQRIKAAKKKGHQAIIDAIDMGDKWQRKSYKQNRFGWIDSPANPDKKDKAYAKTIRDAIADSIAWVDQEYQRTKDAEVAYNATLSNGTTEAVKDSILVLSSQEAQLYQKRTERRTGTLIFFDIFFGLLGWLCEYVQALMRRAGVKVNRKRTLPHVLRKITTSWAEKFLSWLERVFVIDLDGNGDIGSVDTSAGFFTSLFGSTTTAETTTIKGKTAVPTAASTTKGATARTTDYSRGETTTTDRPVVEGFRTTKSDVSPTTTTANDKLQRVVKEPATPVATGVSPGYSQPRTTNTNTTAPPELVVIKGQYYVVHNGKNRSLDWCRKQLRDYNTRLKDYRKNKKNTTTVEKNIALFEGYIGALERAIGK